MTTSDFTITLMLDKSPAENMWNRIAVSTHMFHQQQELATSN